MGGSEDIFAKITKREIKAKPFEPLNRTENEPKEELKKDKSINIENKKYRFQELSEGKKPKRYSIVTGQEFDVPKGIMLTEDANERLNMAKALSKGKTFNELIDEALNMYFDKLNL